MDGSGMIDAYDMADIAGHHIEVVRHEDDRELVVEGLKEIVDLVLRSRITLAVGSSSSSNSGLQASALEIRTRWRSPPDSCAKVRFAR